MRLCEGRKQEQPSERNVAEEAQHHSLRALLAVPLVRLAVGCCPMN